MTKYNMAEEKKQLGGAREGAGRKSKSGSGSSRFVSFRCAQDVYDILQMQENKTAYIEQAIREKNRRERY